MPATTPVNSRRLLAARLFGFAVGRESDCPFVIGPNRRELIEQIGPRAHRENVADDPANAGGRALKWFDRAGMVVRFDFKRDRQSVADVDDAGVFLAGANQDRGGLGRKRLAAAGGCSCRSSARST